MSKSNFSINPNALRHIRESRGLTQQALADLSFGGGKSSSSDPSTWLRRYHRVEQNGSTTRHTAQLISEALDIEISDLQDGIVESERIRANFITRKLIETVRFNKLCENHSLLLEIATAVGTSLNELLAWDIPDNRWNYDDVSVTLLHKFRFLTFVNKSGERDHLLRLLNINLADLDKTVFRNALWWIYDETNEEIGDFGTVVHSYQKVRVALKEFFARLPCSQLDSIETFIIKTTQHGFSLEAKLGLSSSLLFNCKACTADTNKGINWQKPSRFEADEIKQMLISFAMSNGDIVEVDGEVWPTPGAKKVISVLHYENTKERSYKVDNLIDAKCSFIDQHDQKKWEVRNHSEFSQASQVKTFFDETLGGLDQDAFVFQDTNAGIELITYEKISVGSDTYLCPLKKYEIHLEYEKCPDFFQRAPWKQILRDEFKKEYRPFFELRGNKFEESDDD